MTKTISFTALSALGLALAAATSAAQAQTVISRDISGQPVETVITQQPVRTVTTTETVRIVRPNGRTTERRVVTTRRTVVNQDVVPGQPLYDVVTPPSAPVVAAGTYERPLYDSVVAPVPTVDETVVDAAVAPLAPAPAVPAYRYIYQPDRILVMDPVANVVVQVIPR
jgi:hypothetical protein